MREQAKAHSDAQENNKESKIKNVGFLIFFLNQLFKQWSIFRFDDGQHQGH